MSRMPCRLLLRAIAHASILSGSIVLGGCATTPVAADDADSRATMPVVADSAVIWVQGMSCPKCVTNVDLQIRRLPGVSNVAINMNAGTVAVTFDGINRPTHRELRGAVEDAGLSYLRAEYAQ